IFGVLKMGSKKIKVCITTCNKVRQSDRASAATRCVAGCCAVGCASVMAGVDCKCCKPCCSALRPHCERACPCCFPCPCDEERRHKVSNVIDLQDDRASSADRENAGGNTVELQTLQAINQASMMHTEPQEQELDGGTVIVEEDEDEKENIDVEEKDDPEDEEQEDNEQEDDEDDEDEQEEDNDD
ncbi:MAG: hypothetical protein AAF471_07615, partial [Myxococcota bacterium]